MKRFEENIDEDFEYKYTTTINNIAKVIHISKHKHTSNTYRDQLVRKIVYIFLCTVYYRLDKYVSIKLSLINIQEGSDETDY